MNYFRFGEVEMAVVLDGVITVPFGIFMAGRTEIPFAFIGAAVRLFRSLCSCQS